MDGKGEEREKTDRERRRKDGDDERMRCREERMRMEEKKLKRLVKQEKGREDWENKERLEHCERERNLAGKEQR